MKLITFLFFLVFLIGLYFYVKQGNKNTDGFTSALDTSTTSKCPNLLVQKGSMIYLYNTKVAEVPGVNPLIFENLEEYTEFINWQHSQGIRCPVLYLQQTYDAQSNSVYKIRPSVSEPQGGLPPSKPYITTNTSPQIQTSDNKNNGDMINAYTSNTLQTQPSYPNATLLTDSNHDDPPYNYGGYPGMDTTNQNIGQTTPLDAMNNTIPEKYSDPMSDNWLGPEFTQQLIDKGYYKNNEVKIYTP